MNLQELQYETGRLLNDPQNTRWTPDVLTIRINQAQTEVQGETNAVKTFETYTPVANDARISLNADILNVISVQITGSNSSIFPLEGKTREELDFTYPDWQNWQPGKPLLWWFKGSEKKIQLVPAPDSANAITDGIGVYESLKPADLVNSTDIPFDSNNQMVPYHMSIVHWVVAQCWMDDGTPEALNKARFHRSGNPDRPGEYENQIKRIKAEFDIPTAIDLRILWKPQGARLGSFSQPTKAYPFR